MTDAVLWYALCLTLLAFCAAVLIAVTAIQDDWEGWRAVLALLPAIFCMVALAAICFGLIV